MRNPFGDWMDDAVTPRSFVRQAWAGFWILLVLIAVLMLGLHFIARANAQGLGFTDAQCRQLAHFARTTAEIRDLGAQLELHVQLVRRRVAEGGVALSVVVERELRRVYAMGRAPEAAEVDTFNRCMTGEILRKEG